MIREGEDRFDFVGGAEHIAKAVLAAEWMARATYFNALAMSGQDEGARKINGAFAAVLRDSANRLMGKTQ